MAARIYTDKDVDLASLRGKTCAVIGFGAQGRAHALNLRDSGVRVIIGLQRGSRSRPAAKRHRLKIFDTPEAAARGDIVFLGVPDTSMSQIYDRDVAPSLRARQTLLFAHGFAVHYRTIRPRKDVDVVMVAPKGLGPMVRREFVGGRGVPALVAVHQNVSGQAKKTALAWAKGIGCTRAGVLETTFREETETDLFGEQAVLCGGTSALIRTAFDTLVRAGYPAELAYFECLHELKFIVDLIHQAGLRGMRAMISETARWGELTVGPEIIGLSVARQMQAVLSDIRRGKFARKLLRETATGRKQLHRLTRDANRHPIEKVGARLRGLMAWRSKTKLR